MGATPPETSFGIPDTFDGWEDVIKALTAVVTRHQRPRLVVLDDVWEREVVDALQPAGFRLLGTTRDLSVVTSEGTCTKVEGMVKEEAVEMLRLASGAGQALPQPEASQVKFRNAYA